MANSQVSHTEAKSICDKLECSPSQHDTSGYQGGAPNTEPTAKSSETTPSAHKTSEFQMKDRGQKISGYSGRFADKSKRP